ncbi:hypothetical protein ABIA33_004467 [Streptacidiphilus sp. MAP12-16]|uniref:hypothetical protein n=1 Tax=Streptacidiphilus sp. MAP12-16 TaxID=3156300 RepID=UPI003514B2D0
MFPYLRLARGYGALDLFRWLLTSAASATVAALLLRALGRALTDPATTGAAAQRLLWCLPALAAVGYLATAWARSLPTQRPERVAGLVAAGAGPLRMRLLLAGEIALACAVGTLLALVGYLTLRSHVLELTPGTRLDLALGVHSALPPAATAALLSVVPLLGGLAAAAAVRTADLLPSDGSDQAQRRPSVPYLAVAIALPAAGTALELMGLRERGSAAALTGWLLAVVGIAVAVPLLLYGVGALLAWGRPRTVRLLAGRGLQSESWRLGTPLAVLAVTGAIGAVAAVRSATGHGPTGPLPLIEAALLAVCVVGALLTRLAELATARRSAYASLRRMGAPGAVYLQAAALRAGAATIVVLTAGASAAALAAAALTF